MKGFPMIAKYAAAVLGLLTVSPALADPPGEGEQRGFHPKIRANLGEFGHLPELNGKYRMRVTEITIEPDGGMGPHHHLGPGVRCLSAGEMTYTINGQTTVYRAGDCFTETGDVSHTTRNTGMTPVVLYNFEILPANLPDSKGSIIPIPK